MSVLRQILKQFALFIFGWLLASILIFGTIWLLPGDVAQIIGGTTATPAEIAEIRTRLGLDQPLHVQYFKWIFDFLQGNLGTSLISGLSIADQLAWRATISLPLVAMAFLITLLIAVPLGFWGGYRAGHTGADVATASGFTIAAAPLVLIALIIISVFSLRLGVFPAQGFNPTGWQDPLSALRSLFLPALTIGIIEAAIVFRFVRSSVLDAVRSAPVLTGMSFGLTRMQAVLRFGMPQAGLNLLGVFGVQLATMIVSSVVIERLYALPGIGSMLVADIGGRDLPKVASVLLLITSFILVLGFIIDLAQKLIDPRLRTAVRK
ncbi:ABC transporter permease [Canibacter sp. lx-72]|uniref:ABC transporter permease n=1 Tax=Canibacter zhuwentaonis TaxID=2837491 RepID=UPI001BDC8DBD|nr:ABC transporter permease [Canibacter zhuwentaonis]MBT1017544.1 ABC transporter permease [Canibacter zhuwentaonis]